MEPEVFNAEEALLKNVFIHSDSFNILYSKFFPEAKSRLSFRPLYLPKDLKFLYGWVNHPFAKTFWQMEGSIDDLEKTYRDIMKSPFTHSFIGMLNNEPVCQADVYHVQHDELKEHVTATEKDYGIHFLMSPVRKKIHHLSVCCMQTCLAFLFSFKDVERIFGEPDERNTKANQLVIKAGFQFLYSAKLSYKTANVYCCTKEAFVQKHLYNLSSD